MLDSVQALEDLAAQGSRGEGTTEGWTAVAAQAKTIADALRTGESSAGFAELHKSGQLISLPSCSVQRN
jgi:hypothetical protein